MLSTPYQFTVKICPELAVLSQRLNCGCISALIFMFLGAIAPLILLRTPCLDTLGMLINSVCG